LKKRLKIPGKNQARTENTRTARKAFLKSLVEGTRQIAMEITK